MTEAEQQKLLAPEKSVGSIRNCSFTNNAANSGPTTSAGGALMLQSTGVNVYDSYFFGNSCDDRGGAIYVVQGATPQEFSRNLFQQNFETQQDGSAIYLYGYTGSIFSITNSTFFQNIDLMGAALAITHSSTVNVANNTFVANSSNSGPSGAIDAITSVNLTNNLFQQNKGYTSSSNVASNCSGSTITGGHNFSDNAASDCNLGSSDYVSTSVATGSASSFGGPTDSIQTPSAARGLGLTSACPAVDQRDFPRNLPTSCDIGAFEYQ